MTVDAGFVRQAEGDVPVITMRYFRRFYDGLLVAVFIPQVRFNIGNLAGFDDVFVDVFDGELFGSAQICEHGPLGVRRDQHDAAAGYRSFVQRLSEKSTPAAPMSRVNS